MWLIWGDFLENSLGKSFFFNSHNNSYQLISILQKYQKFTEWCGWSEAWVWFFA